MYVRCHPNLGGGGYSPPRPPSDYPGGVPQVGWGTSHCHQKSAPKLHFRSFFVQSVYTFPCKCGHPTPKVSQVGGGPHSPCARERKIGAQLFFCLPVRVCNNMGDPIFSIYRYIRVPPSCGRSRIPPVFLPFSYVTPKKIKVWPMVRCREVKRERERERES